MADNPFAVPAGRSRVPRFREEAEGLNDGAESGGSKTAAKADGLNNGAQSKSVQPDANIKGFKFFNGRPASTSMQNAKKKSLIEKLRAPSGAANPKDFQGSGFPDEDD